MDHVENNQQQRPCPTAVPVRSLAGRGKKYELVSVLSAGQFGKAIIAFDTHQGKHCVIKRLKRRVDIGVDDRAATVDAELIRASFNEINALSAVRHPFIVEFYEAWIEAADQHLHIAMEFCRGGDLSTWQKLHYPSLPEPLLRRWMVQLLLAVERLHSRRIIHRDIKLANIFLTADAAVVKLGDFGLSKLLQRSDERGATQAGTPYFFSPEIAAGEPHDRKTDVWSLGVVFYCLLENDMPFQARQLGEIFELIRTSEPRPFTEHRGLRYSAEVRDLIGMMLTKSPRHRPSASALLQLRWIAEIAAEQIEQYKIERPLQTVGGEEVLASSNPNISFPHNPSSSSPPRRSKEATTTAVLSYEEVLELRRVQRVLNGDAIDVAVNLRQQPDVASASIGKLRYGDRVVSDGSVVDGAGERWYRIIAPLQAYCVAAVDGQEAFVSLATPPGARMMQMQKMEQYDPRRKIMAVVVINIREAPDLSSPVLGKMRHGERILVLESVQDGCTGELWHHIAVPFNGYCIASLTNQPAFRLLTAAEKR